uniref:Uncharacterized protein n=1 Tax=Entomoneis paludosa TaxID=265537 RepID=A0A7S3DSH9_9STRA|mmetsp:Transcript_334/g.837  ORF Transcript_334/g.837 Transcript_334/m.837 type:complete len:665 (+) Transcript_334:217-2211(+)
MEYLGDNGGGLVGLLGIEDPGGGRPFGSPRSGRRKLKKAPPPGVQNKCDSSSDEEENHVDSLASLPPQPEQGKFIDRRAAMERVPSFFSVVRESTSKDPPPPASPAARLDDSRAVAAPGLQRMGSKRRLSFDANEQDDLQGGDDDDATRGLPRMSSKRRLLGNDDEEETSSDEDGHAMGAQRNYHFPDSYPPQGSSRRGPPFPGEYHQHPPHSRGPGPAGYGRQPPANQYPPHEEQRYSRRPGPPPMQTSRYPREPAPRGHHQHTQEFRHDPRRRGPSPYEQPYGPPRDSYHPAPPSRDRGGGPPRIIHPRPYYQPPPPSSSSTSMIAPYHHHHPSYPQPRDRRGSGSGDEGEYSVVTRSSREEDLPYDLESIKSFEEEEEELLVSTMMSHSMRLQERGGPSSSEPPPPRYRGESPGGHHSPQQQQQRGGPPPPPRRSGDPAGDRLVRREDSVQWVHHDSPVGPAVSVYPKGYDHGRGRQSSEPIIHYHESSASPGPQDDYPSTAPPQQQRSRSTSFSGPDGYRNNDPQGTSSSTKQYQRRSSLQGSTIIQRPGRRRPAAMVEISPGVQVKLRGASETKECVRRDFFVPCQCCSCDLDMFCIQDADYVLCPQCRVVNPLDTHNNNDSKDSKQPTGPGGGLGLGFTMTDLAQMQQEAMAHGNNHQ